MICRVRFYAVMLPVMLLVTFGHSFDLEAFAPAKGMYLVADEQLADPRFRDRVILLIQHDAGGSAGLVVNRSSRLPLASVLPKESPLAGMGKTLSYGGPVEPNTLLALVKVRKHPPEPAERVLDNIYVTGLEILDSWPDFAVEVVEFRPFVGYTGWAPGQLNVEMMRGDWQLVPADEESVFAGRDEQLWKALQDMPAKGR